MISGLMPSKRGSSFKERESALLDAAKDYVEGGLSLEAFQEVMDEKATDYAGISLKIARTRKGRGGGFLSFLLGR